MTAVRFLLIVSALAAVLGGNTRADDAVLRVEASEPRAYGYQVGDHVQRHVVVQAPAGWTLDEASLPRPGGRGTALELRSVQRRTTAVGGGQRIELDLDYQVFLAPAVVRTVEIAPIALRFTGASRTEDLRIDAWPVTIAPLLQVEAPTRRGLGELQPDRPPLLRDTSALRTRLLAWAAIALLLITTLAVAYLGPPWRAARQRPFGVAWRQLRRLPAQPGDPAWRAACVQLHEALNRTAGEVLFERDLDAFVQRQPGFAPLREDLQRFLHTTREQFFGGAPRNADDGRWLVALCRRCRDAERGLL
jgi:mxaA protein